MTSCWRKPGPPGRRPTAFVSAIGRAGGGMANVGTGLETR